MRGVFEDDESEHRPQRDTELTLGSGTLLLIFFGLVAVCGLCFGLGYAVGRRSVPGQIDVAAPQSASSQQAPLPANAAQQKPSAMTQTVVAPIAPGGATTGATAAPQPVAPPAQTPVNVAPQAVSNREAQPQVHPALATVPANLQPAVAPATVRPAMGQQSPLMVQIAAVQNPEDAEVLMNALRKRGYAVTARRDFSDNLIHVRIGPFATRNEAYQWQQRLLNDGYNAVILP